MMEHRQGPKKPGREERLEVALRENLRKRKALERQRAEITGDKKPATGNEAIEPEGNHR